MVFRRWNHILFLSNEADRKNIKYDAVGLVTYLHTYLLTEPSPSCEATNCAATQELRSILRNPKDHHRIHKSPPLVPILSQIDSAHNISSYLSKIYFSIVYPPMSWSS
jgi:hypothetical protein